MCHASQQQELELEQHDELRRHCDVVVVVLCPFARKESVLHLIARAGHTQIIIFCKYFTHGIYLDFKMRVHVPGQPGNFKF